MYMRKQPLVGTTKALKRLGGLWHSHTLQLSWACVFWVPDVPGCTLTASNNLVNGGCAQGPEAIEWTIQGTETEELKQEFRHFVPTILKFKT